MNWSLKGDQRPLAVSGNGDRIVTLVDDGSNRRALAISFDRGESWELRDVQNLDTILKLELSGNGEVLYISNGSGSYKSTDGGLSFTLLTRKLSRSSLKTTHDGATWFGIFGVGQDKLLFSSARLGFDSIERNGNLNLIYLGDGKFGVNY
jgi:hypothetical protein